jgi:hypothetical protein
LKVKCPACGATASLDALIGHKEALDAFLTALALPGQLGPQLIKYVALFRPPQRDLSLARAGKLLEELAPMIQAAQIQRSGRDWPAPLESWKAALEIVINKPDLTRPLKDHGLLLQIICNQSNRAESQAEQRREEARQHRPPGQRSGMRPVVDATRHIGSMRDALKGRPPLGAGSSAEDSGHGRGDPGGSPPDQSGGAPGEAGG